MVLLHNDIVTCHFAEQIKEAVKLVRVWNNGNGDSDKVCHSFALRLGKTGLARLCFSNFWIKCGLKKLEITWSSSTCSPLIFTFNQVVVLYHVGGRDSTVPRQSRILTQNVCSRPSGSEQNIPTTGLPEAAKSTNPDHVGGYQAALPIISGMESKFGLSLPKNTAVA